MSVPAQPEVAFHFNVADPLRYLCRLLRKVHQAGMSALVCVPPALARELDQALWTFAAEEEGGRDRHPPQIEEEGGTLGYPLSEGVGA